jgi:acetamidase/formamidase
MKTTRFTSIQIIFITVLVMLFLWGCTGQDQDKESENAARTPKPQYFLKRNQTHNKFSRKIAPVLRVPSGAVIEAETEEASDKQVTLDSSVEDLTKMSFDPIHPLTGPVYVEGAQPGDVLAVTLHKVEIGDWGWVGVFPGFGLLADEFKEPYYRAFKLGKDAKSIRFSDKITIPLKPFPGVMGVAPDTEEMLSTIPPRANGGNMDDPHLTEGTTVYFPVFVEGALFSIGDCHSVQGAGEVCGTAVESPMRIIYEVNVIKGKPFLREPQYETDTYYAVTAFATTLDEAAKKAMHYMVDYLEAEHGLDRTEAYVLCSLAGDLKIAEVVDAPHMLVSVHISKKIFHPHGMGDL